MNLLHFCFVLLVLYTIPVFCKHKNKNCDKEAKGLAEAVRQFLYCSVSNAVPVHVCLKCHGEFKIMETHYSSFMKKCKVQYTEADRLSVVETVYMNAVSIWERGFCSECFSNGAVSDSIAEILTVSGELQSCMEQHNTTFCELCSGHYEKLKGNYLDFVQKHENGICFDVRDEMNRTYSEWLKCSHSMPSLAVFSTMVPLVLLLPIVFYGSLIGVYVRSRYHSILREEGNEENDEIETTDDWTAAGIQFNFTSFTRKQSINTERIDEVLPGERPGPSSNIESNPEDTNDINLKRRSREGSDDDESLLQL